MGLVFLNKCNINIYFGKRNIFSEISTKSRKPHNQVGENKSQIPGRKTLLFWLVVSRNTVRWTCMVQKSKIFTMRWHWLISSDHDIFVFGDYLAMWQLNCLIQKNHLPLKNLKLRTIYRFWNCGLSIGFEIAPIWLRINWSFVPTILIFFI
jgi:hypothetical protein